MPHWVSEEIWVGPPTGTKIRTSKPKERKGGGVSGPRSKHRIQIRRGRGEWGC